jgi:hypothetical protein
MRRLRDAIVANPLTALLFVAFLIAEYGNCKRGRELTQLCELFSYPDVTFANPKTGLGKLANLCNDRLSNDGPDE